MIKRIVARQGKMKFFSLIKERQNNFDSPNLHIQLVEANIWFFESNGRIDLGFKFKGKKREIELSFDIFDVNNPTNFQYLDDDSFKFPRLKLLKGEFILSGLWEDEKQKWLAVGKFPGTIPEGYVFHKDELTYETIFPI